MVKGSIGVIAFSIIASRTTASYIVILLSVTAVKALLLHGHCSAPVRRGYCTVWLHYVASTSLLHRVRSTPNPYINTPMISLVSCIVARGVEHEESFETGDPVASLVGAQ